MAGGLLVWANQFITNEVHDQLAAQKITMPTDQTGLADLPAEDKAALEPYAGQQMTTGKQAQAYADHYIAVHLDADGRRQDLLRGWRRVQRPVLGPYGCEVRELSDPRRSEADAVPG